MSGVIPKVIWNLGDIHDSNSKGANPKRIIDEIINKLAVEMIPLTKPVEDHPDLVGVPVLAPREGPMQFLDVKMRTRSAKKKYNYKTKCTERTKKHFRADIRMERQEMYVLGFKGGAHTNFFEFRNIESDEKGELIPNSSDLYLNGGYVGSGSVNVAARGSTDSSKKGTAEGSIDSSKEDYRYEVALCRYNTVKHIKLLHKYNPERTKISEVARAMVYMIILVSEAPRFKKIKKKACEQWWKKHDICEPLPEDVVQMVRKWSKLSELLQQKVQDVTYAAEIGIAKREKGWFSEAEKKKRGGR